MSGCICCALLPCQREEVLKHCWADVWEAVGVSLMRDNLECTLELPAYPAQRQACFTQ